MSNKDNQIDMRIKETSDSQELFHSLKSILSEVWDAEEAISIAFILLEHHYKWTRSHVITREPIPPTDLSLLIKDVHRLLNQEPVQYVIGKAAFMGMELEVNSEVLIPRPETEELVALIAENHPEAKSIIDLGTGSGCIPIGLKKLLPKTEITAMDVSGTALEVAKRNAINEKVDINFYQADVLKEHGVEKAKFDIIVSNPPYVLKSEEEEMKIHVIDYEPAVALFVPDDSPLIFYERIAQIAKDQLTAGGVLYFEINERFGIDTAQLCEHVGFTKTQVVKDFNGKDRFVTAQ